MLATKLARWADQLKLIDKMDAVSRSIVISQSAEAMRQASQLMSMTSMTLDMTDAQISEMTGALDSSERMPLVAVPVTPQKSCGTCKHADVKEYRHPCNSCISAAQSRQISWSNWQPK